MSEPKTVRELLPAPIYDGDLCVCVEYYSEVFWLKIRGDTGRVVYVDPARIDTLCQALKCQAAAIQELPARREELLKQRQAERRLRRKAESWEDSLPVLLNQMEGEDQCVSHSTILTGCVGDVFSPGAASE